MQWYPFISLPAITDVISHPIVSPLLQFVAPGGEPVRHTKMPPTIFRIPSLISPYITKRPPKPPSHYPNRCQLTVDHQNKVFASF